jgi:hypothetical protein
MLVINDVKSMYVNFPPMQFVRFPKRKLNEEEMQMFIINKYLHVFAFILVFVVKPEENTV